MTGRTVYLIDDDETVRKSVSFLLRTLGFEVRTWSSGVVFLRAAASLDLCPTILDVRMPAMDGFAVQEQLIARHIPLPLIMLTGHGDIDLAVQAMRMGAIDFIEKPANAECLEVALKLAYTKLRESHSSRGEGQSGAQAVATLTSRERDVLDRMVKGLPNKSIAHDLGISHRTVEVHRARVMRKLNARNLSDALKIAIAADVS